MGQISKFLRSFTGGFAHFCPACAEPHFINTEKPNPQGALWRWDGNIIQPTIHPSVNIRAIDDGKVIYCCHYWLIDGDIHYLNDCTHDLAGTTVRLPPLPEYLREKCLV